MVAGCTSTCSLLPALPGRDGREGLPGPPGPPGAPCTLPQPTGLSYNYPAEGCEEIVRNNPQSTNGWYWVRDSSDNSTKRVNCYPNGHISCGKGVWMRIGYFDKGSNLAECPEPLKQLNACQTILVSCTSHYYCAIIGAGPGGGGQ